jgi:hypothetical protein
MMRIKDLRTTSKYCCSIPNNFWCIFNLFLEVPRCWNIVCKKSLAKNWNGWPLFYEMKLNHLHCSWLAITMLWCVVPAQLMECLACWALHVQSCFGLWHQMSFFFIPWSNTRSNQWAKLWNVSITMQLFLAWMDPGTTFLLLAVQQRYWHCDHDCGLHEGIYSLAPLKMGQRISGW